MRSFIQGRERRRRCTFLERYQQACRTHPDSSRTPFPPLVIAGRPPRPSPDLLGAGMYAPTSSTHAAPPPDLRVPPLPSGVPAGDSRQTRSSPARIRTPRPFCAQRRRQAGLQRPRTNSVRTGDSEALADGHLKMRGTTKTHFKKQQQHVGMSGVHQTRSPH